MTFLTVFAQLVVENWRQLDLVLFADSAERRGVLTKRWLRGFEALCERTLDKLTLHGVVDGMIERGILRGGRAV